MRTCVRTACFSLQPWSPDAESPRAPGAAAEGLSDGDAKYAKMDSVEFSAYLTDRTRGGNRAYVASCRELISSAWNVIEGEQH